MTAIRDPYPADLRAIDSALPEYTHIDDTLEPIVADPTAQALNRIATALEQLVLATLDKPAAPPQPVQNAPLAVLPPVVAPTAAAGVCPDHGTPWKIVPAGVSKRTGKPYDAFAACSTAGCDQRPPR